MDNKLMRRTLNALLLSSWLLLLFNKPVSAGAKPKYFNDTIKIQGNWFYLNKKKFFINAVGYAPWRPGQWPGQDKVGLDLVEEDFRRIKDAGFNSVRTWDALGPEELRLAKKYGLKVVQGIWIDPNHDFSDPYFIRDSLEYIRKVVNWSKDYDNVLMYLVITEPTQQAILFAGTDKTLEFFGKIKATIQKIDNKPVSLDSWISAAFIDHSLWDVVTFNAFKFTPESINRVMGFKNYVAWFKRNHGRDKPLFVGETGGFSVSRTKLNELGFGGNSEAGQAMGDIESIQEAIEAGVAGVCTVAWVDTWHYPTDPTTHDEHPWEWDGIVGMKDINDKLGTPRKVYYELKAFNKRFLFPKGEKNVYSPYAINIAPRKTEFNSGEKISAVITITKNGQPVEEQKVDFGFFMPVGWKEENASGETDKNGRLQVSCGLLSEPQSQYVVICAGFVAEGERYADMQFIKISAQRQAKSFGQFPVYVDKDFPNNHFFPSGWSGDYPDLRFNDAYTKDAHSGKNCIEIIYTAKNSFGGGWAGIYWQNPLNNWDDARGAMSLSGAKKLTFWAKGARGGERIEEFGVGGSSPNSALIKFGPVILTSEWKQYSIDLLDKDLSRIIHGFHFFIRKDSNPAGCTFYIDDIIFEMGSQADRDIK